MYNPNFSIPSSTLPLTKCVQTRHTSNSFGGIIVKLLARADFYQQKMKELEKLDLQFEKKKAPCSSETTDSGNSALSSLQVQLATNKFKIRPRRIKIWYFDYACKKAMMFAEHFGFDIRCEIGGGWGHIQLWADALCYDASWGNNKYLRMFLSIVNTADVVLIEPKYDKRGDQIRIELSFQLVQVYNGTATEHCDVDFI